MQPKDLLPPSFEIELQKSDRLNKRMAVLNTFWIISGIILLLNCIWVNFFLLPQQSGAFSDYLKTIIIVWVDGAVAYLIFGKMTLIYFVTSGIS